MAELNRGGQGERRGFAGMDPQKQREISRKGGESVSQDRQHMSQIGRKGGEASHGGQRSREPSIDENP